MSALIARRVQKVVEPFKELYNKIAIESHSDDDVVSTEKVIMSVVASSRRCSSSSYVLARRARNPVSGFSGEIIFSVPDSLRLETELTLMLSFESPVTSRTV